MGDVSDTGGYDEAGMNVGMDIPDYEDEFDFVERQGPNLPPAVDDRYDFVNDLPDDALDFVTTSGESLTDDTLGTSPSFETQEEAIDRALREALGDDIPTAEQISPEDFRENEAALAGIDFNTGLPIGGTTPDEDIEKGGVLYESTIDSIKDRVSDVEGTSDAGGYDRLLGGQEGNFGVNPSTMTIAEVLAFQAKRGEGSYASYSQGVNKKNNQLRADGTPKISTPVGKYQVVGSTLQGLVDNGIVDINDKFDAATQEKIGTHLIESRGFQDSLDGTITEQQFEQNLGKEFQGIEFQGYNSDGTFTADPQLSGTSNESATDLYLSAMDKISADGYDPDKSNLSAEEQAALYGARGQTPNAAETAYLQNLLGDAKHAEDGPIVDGKPLYKAGDTVRPETFGDKAGDFIVGVIDALFNPLSILGGKFTLAGQIDGATDKRVEEQLQAYKNGGTFVYDENGSVVGLAEANYDASGDGLDDTVVIFDEDGEIKVTGDGLDTKTIEESNEFSDENDEILIVDSDEIYTNPEEEGGEVVITKPEVEVPEIDNSSIGDDSSICEEGFEFDPEEGICMPIDEIGDGTGRRKVKIKKRTPRTVDPVDPVLPTPRPTTGGLAVRQPSFNKGGVVTRNIDKFANGGVVTPNIDNFFGSMR